MKIKSVFMLTSILLLICNAQAASKDRGGGDLCEKRIIDIAEDIDKWIRAGGAKSLKFKSGLEYQNYETNMLDSFSSTKIRCVKNGDSGFPVRIGDTAKTCRFDNGTDGKLITCDYDIFMNRSLTSESDQYVLIHHEFAGIAGVENPNGESSTYEISSQISGFLENVVEKKLVVKPADTANPSNPGCTVEKVQPIILAGIKAYIIKTFGESYSPVKVDSTSIQVEYKGLLDFEDIILGVNKELAYDVTFKSETGTIFQIISFNPDFLRIKQPLFMVFSVPMPFVETVYDREGNVTGHDCIVKTHRGYNRSAAFVNRASGKQIEDDLISSSFSELGRFPLPE